MLLVVVRGVLVDSYATTFNSSFFDQLAVQARVRNEVFRDSPRLAWFLAGFLWAFCGVIMFVLAGALNQYYFPALPALAIWVLLMLLVGFPIARFYPLGSRRRVEWLDAKYGTLMSFYADREGVTWSAQGSRSWVAWSNVAKMLYAGDVIAFVVGATGLLLPRRAFENDQAMKSFVVFALEQMTPSAREATILDRSMQQFFTNDNVGDRRG
jgi:hypothetical protein